jgi:nitrile hydratase subunit beta
MNGIHDMGGLQGTGPVEHEENEPVFHSVWEGRVLGINASLRAMGIWNLDAWRHEIESIPPVDYLRMSYYERWLRINEQLLVKHGLVSPHELETGKPDPGSAKAIPALTAAGTAQPAVPAIPSGRDPSVRPQFEPGQRVRARNMNPRGHTRLPRYVRGKRGIITRDHGVYAFPDTNAHYQGEKRQHVYSVRFSAPELWGEEASVCDSVHLDMWDDYLEHA